MMLPTDFGFHFPSFRPHQLDTALWASTNKSFCSLLDMPTGGGKSLCAMTASKLSGSKTVYVVSTKSLQDQISKDFPRVAILKGRANYVCQLAPHRFPEYNASMCIDSRDFECPETSDCPYMTAKRKALSAQVACLNIAYFLTEVNHVGSFNNTPLLTVDEIDTAEEQLMSFISLVITQKQIERYKLPMPRHKTVFESWIEWSKEAATLVSDRLSNLRSSLDSENPDPYVAKDCEETRRFLSKLAFFAAEVNQHWVWYPSGDRWEFKPVWVSSYAQKYLWSHVGRAIGMSATILNPRQLASNIGLSDYSYRQLPSLFPPENRRIFYMPVASVTRRNEAEAYPAIAKSVASVLSSHPDEKILCHTVSYKLARFLRAAVASERFLYHDNALGRGNALETFKQTSEPAVLLSPSMERGVDLPYEACRVAVVCKLPFPNLGDPQVSKRLYSGPEGQRWYAYATACSLVQMTGRHVRAVDDRGVSYICDAEFGRFYGEYEKLFPEWWKSALIM